MEHRKIKLKKYKSKLSLNFNLKNPNEINIFNLEWVKKKILLNEQNDLSILLVEVGTKEKNFNISVCM